MWGTHSVGKLVAGPEPMKPAIEVFVDDVAGADVVQKVQRRLQHFIDRKIAALFEPLLELQRDETLSGLARGLAFRLVEGLGILARADVTQEVKDLDQDARATLRKHGLRFGQFTIFMPLLLKPAPTRLRLVLWSLAQGLQEFVQSPPPGLVTVPALTDAPKGYHTMCGYRAAGERAIRIDMLERLADMLRGENSRAGFEAKADMLSITGMTLEQFADLMTGLGYKAAQGERIKVKATPDASEKEAVASAEEPAPAPEATAPAEASPETPPETPDPPAEESASAPTEETAEPDAPEMQVFYTFTWAHRPVRGPSKQGDAQQSQGKGAGKRDGTQDGKRGSKPGNRRGNKPGAKSGAKPPQGAKTFSARPPKQEKPIDPDNPFAAALMGLKDAK